MTDKQYISAQSLLDDAFRLGAMVYDSGFRPSFILALWRGGVPIGIAVQEYLAHRGVKTNHIAIRAASYTGINEQSAHVRIYGISYLLKNISHNDRLLIVDDVFDTGSTIEAVIRELKEKARLNAPEDIRVAVPYYKPLRNRTPHTPDYYAHETSRWIKFPHSLEGLTPEEVKQHRPELYDIVSSVEESSGAD